MSTRALCSPPLRTSEPDNDSHDHRRHRGDSAQGAQRRPDRSRRLTRDEAPYTAVEIKRLLETPFLDDPKKLAARGLAFSDSGILGRVKSLIPKIAAALDHTDVRYVVGGVAVTGVAEECLDSRKVHS